MSGVEYVVIGFSKPTQIRAGFDRLAALAAPEALEPVEIVDVEFIHSIHGIASTVPAGRVDPALAGFDRFDTRLLGQADLDVVAGAITPGSTAAVVVFRGAPVAPALEEWADAGVTVLRAGSGVPAAGLLGG